MLEIAGLDALACVQTYMSQTAPWGGILKFYVFLSDFVSNQYLWHSSSQLPLFLSAVVPHIGTESKKTLKTHALVRKHGSSLQPLLPSQCFWFGFPTDVTATLHSQKLVKSY